MKKIFYLLGLICILSACSKETTCECKVKDLEVMIQECASEVPPDC